MKIVDFSETIEACDLKVGRYRQLIGIEGHFLTLTQGRVHTKIQTKFSQKLLCYSEPNFV